MWLIYKLFWPLIRNSTTLMLRLQDQTRGWASCIKLLYIIPKALPAFIMSVLCSLTIKHQARAKPKHSEMENSNNTIVYNVPICCSINCGDSFHNVFNVLSLSHLKVVILSRHQWKTALQLPLALPQILAFNLYVDVHRGRFLPPMRNQLTIPSTVLIL